MMPPRTSTSPWILKKAFSVQALGVMKELGLKAMVTEPKLLVPFGLFVITVTLGILLGLGIIQPAACPSGLTCTYAKTTEQAANVMISLASASVGALIGMFATASGGSTAKPAGGAK